MRPDFGFEKLPVDLRQIPKEFLKLPDCDYVFLTQQIDRHFSVHEKVLHILDALCKLEDTYKATNVITEEEELRSELDIRFDFKVFEFFFNTLYQCLEGDLGNQFFEQKTDFLMKLSYFIWKKYIVQAIVQQHHIYEMKL